MHKELAREVGEWSLRVFGPGSAKSRSLRLLAEVVELCHAAGAEEDEIDEAIWQATADLARKGAPSPDPDKLPEEAADCGIVLLTLAHTLGIDLEAEIATKHARNTRRTWRITGEGVGQHVEEGGQP